MRMVIAGGGTGGHVLPAVAVLEELRQREIDLDILWIGSEAGLERTAASQAGVPFRAIPTGKLRRYVDLHTILDLPRIPLGTLAAWRILREFRPDVVFSTGGFVSVPTVVAAAWLAPILTHEQTSMLGLANRINLRFVDILAVSYDSTIGLSRGHTNVILTGNPIRASLHAGIAERGLDQYGFSADLPLIYVTGGARGASPLNERIGELLPGILNTCQILHQTGPASANEDAARLSAVRANWSESYQARYRPVAFIGEELADVYAATSLVIGRAGAGTVAELAALGKPAILIPLPGAASDEQTQNARPLAAAGAALLIPQIEATPARLDQT
ncbi:MAG: UDP-N-acetylglucosamine--N-acetylmuramyl-(pentapeptide) pyrophosphoryl-undecaprenol N-acetylglucosamine transferase, partial [Chloroflexota bacterium]|nr:UDP-N-acetylglucosamine--N-acetylmuramyl-(pentapeptide) pyrophosphoryl-undecaprenol N-acetylglucosamine transferase [Chloroflexota bacterium]